MIEPKNSDITTTAVYNRLRELGDVLQVPMREACVDVVVKESIKLQKAQELVKRKLIELKLMK